MDGLYAIAFFGFALLVPVFLLISRSKKRKEYYSFGLLPAKQIVKLLFKKDYAQAEGMIYALNSDDSTQTFDYIGLRLKEAELIAWLEQSDKKEVPSLALGVFHLHQAWKARGASLGSEVSDSKADKFTESLNKSLHCFLEIPDGSNLVAEKYTRLIRVYMGLNEEEKLHDSFKKAVEVDNEKLWTYVAYSTAVQPKWGGSIEQVQKLDDGLPKKELIKQIVHLKLLWDGEVIGENYFGGTLEEGKKATLKYTLELDEKLKGNLPTSIHKYMLFNFMANVFIDNKKRRLGVRYLGLSKGYLALDPHGFQGG